jgi:lysozyme
MWLQNWLLQSLESKTGLRINRARLTKQLRIDEGVSYKVYRCPAGFDTVGVGRNLEALGLTDQELKYLGMESMDEIYETELSDADVEYLLSNDIDRVVDEINDNFEWFAGLNDVRKEVVVNMVFNLGLPRFKQFKKMIAAIKDGDFDRASREGMDSRWYTQVGDRGPRLMVALLTGQW